MPNPSNSFSNKPLRILSIDGGGVRGIVPARLLTEMEQQLQTQYPGKSLWQCFDLITGTSTGGIIALAIAFGIPAKEVLDFYLTKSKIIFGNKKWAGSLFYAKHERADLERIVRDLFAEYHGGADPLIGDCKTHVAIPIYDLNTGCPRILKSAYHPLLERDHQLPAYMAAMATSAAPTFFEPYSAFYRNFTGKKIDFLHNIDGGLFANNPSLGCLIEVQRSFNVPLKDISMLSLGTGHLRHFDQQQRSNYGLFYWMRKSRLIEVFLQAQAQEVENLISIMKNGLGKSDPDSFTYIRADAEMNSKTKIELDETSPRKLAYLSDIGRDLWHKHQLEINKEFLN